MRPYPLSPIKHPIKSGKHCHAQNQTSCPQPPIPIKLPYHGCCQNTSAKIPIHMSFPGYLFSSAHSKRFFFASVYSPVPYCASLCRKQKHIHPHNRRISQNSIFCRKRIHHKPNSRHSIKCCRSIKDSRKTISSGNPNRPAQYSCSSFFL